MTGKINNIQHLRGIAALVVVISHLLSVSGRYGGWGNHDGANLPGGFGVDIFFIISGFIMVWTTGDAFGATGASARFLVKRMIRIVPIYWLLTLVEASLLLASRHHDPAAPALDGFGGKLAASLLFVPYLNDVGKYRPILGVGWSLNFEMLFYAIFAIGLLFPRRIGLGVIGAIFCALLAIGSIAPAGPLAAWGSPILCEFLIGVTIASIVRARPHAFWRIRLSPAPFVLLGIGAATWLGTVDDGMALGWRPLSWALAAAIVLACLLARDATDDGRIARALTMLGDSSYSLYLFHTFVIIQTTIVLKKAGLLAHLPWSLYLAGMLALAVVTGHLFYRFVEQPLSRVLHERLLPKRRTAVAVA